MTRLLGARCSIDHIQMTHPLRKARTVESDPGSSAPRREHKESIARAYRGKRVFDLLLVCATSPAWIPLLCGIGVCVRVALGRPIFFRQRRVGRDDVEFTVFKFRTMRDLRDHTGAPLSDAERLTRFGRFLRSSSLDELPELLNVLRGSMSLVGPRPLLPSYLPLYSREHRHRHDVLPGITGLAQISGRNAISWGEKFDLDIEYIRANSLRADFHILVKTVWSVLQRKDISAPGDATMPFFSGYGDKP